LLTEDSENQLIQGRATRSQGIVWLPTTQLSNDGPRGIQRVSLANREDILGQWLIEQLAKVEVVVDDAIRNSATRHDSHSRKDAQDCPVSNVVIRVTANPEARHREPTMVLVQIASGPERIVRYTGCVQRIGYCTANVPDVTDENQNLSCRNSGGDQIASRLRYSAGLQRGTLKSPT
jgi:hypothetical protein